MESQEFNVLTVQVKIYFQLQETDTLYNFVNPEFIIYPQKKNFLLKISRILIGDFGQGQLQGFHGIWYFIQHVPEAFICLFLPVKNLW
ncbi:MAG TPA: hypothetical protein VK462_07105 [Nitrososphaeraceae archaeon]|nr:hypothetical protein [Nitrososphaeraceae archaeon]